MDQYPRVLVISNNCFSKSGSNGRTLGSFFRGFPSKNIAQFYLNNETPDVEVASTYFRVTDHEALRAFLHGETVGGRVTVCARAEPANRFGRRVPRTPWTMMLRNLIWRSNRWQRSGEFAHFIDEFDPEIVVLQSGDSTFMLQLATNISQERSVPLILFNSEDYYFKSHNYLRNRRNASILYRVWHRNYRRQFEETMSRAFHVVYSCDLLQETSAKRFSGPSSVIMTSTEIMPQEQRSSHHIPVVSYLGNLGLGRAEALVHVGEALHDMNSNYRLDVYGNIPTRKIRDFLSASKGIRYRGFVPYEQVVEVLRSSDLLVHAENSSEFYRRDLKHAFSTKLADALGSGTCLLLYAPRGLACTDYMLQNGAAIVVSDKDDLKGQLQLILSDEKLRQVYVARGLQVAATNHDSQLNAHHFQQLLLSAVNAGRNGRP